MVAPLPVGAAAATRRLLWLLTAVTAGACTSIAPPAVTVTGTATYRERMALPPDAVFEATLEDVSRADAPALVVASTRVTSPAVPIAFSIRCRSGTHRRQSPLRGARPHHAQRPVDVQHRHRVPGVRCQRRAPCRQHAAAPRRRRRRGRRGAPHARPVSLHGRCGLVLRLHQRRSIPGRTAGRQCGLAIRLCGRPHGAGCAAAGHRRRASGDASRRRRRHAASDAAGGALRLAGAAGQLRGGAGQQQRVAGEHLLEAGRAARAAGGGGGSRA